MVGCTLLLSLFPTVVDNAFKSMVCNLLKNAARQFKLIRSKKEDLYHVFGKCDRNVILRSTMSVYVMFKLIVGLESLYVIQYDTMQIQYWSFKLVQVFEHVPRVWNSVFLP